MSGLVLSMVALCGCATSTHADKHTTKPESQAAVDALAAYRAMWHDMAVASHAADYQSPVLAAHAGGDALEMLQQGLFADARQGGLSRGSPRVQPRVVAVKLLAQSAEVDIVDCFDDRTWPTLFNGHSQDPRTLGRHKTKAVVAKLHGSWKVVELSVGGLRTC